MELRITDNSRQKFSNTDAAFNDLFAIANVPLSELVSANPELLVFPKELADGVDAIGNEQICLLSGKNGAFEVQTGNVVGFVGSGAIELTIASRFSNGTDDYFLQYMLQRVFCPNVFDLPHGYNNVSIFDFLLYLFPFYLNQALAQGLFKEYRRMEYDDCKVKGTIEVSRHIQKNYPFVGRVAYNVREHSYDNRITQLVRHTIEYIKRHKLGRAILEDKETQANVRIIIDSTPSYSSQDLGKVLSANIKEVRHPYFTEYTDLQEICLRILRYEGMAYGSGENKVYGILFDAAWLWEEYLAKILPDFEHPRNKEGVGGFRPFESGSLVRFFPDFYRENEVVCDAKYKDFDGKNPDSSDLHQLISYMHVLKVGEGFFLYPSKRVGGCRSLGELKGWGGEMSVYGFTIPSAELTYDEFCAEMQRQETQIIEMFSN